MADRVVHKGHALRRGHLLIELMVVVSLVCLMTILLRGALTLPSTGFVRASLDELYGVCMLAQKRAMMTGHEQKVVLELDAGAYSCGIQRVILPKEVMFGWLPDVKGPPAHPRAPLAAASTFAGNTMVFKPDGVVSAGSVYLVNAKNTVLYALSSGVGSVSFLRKYRYAKGWQLM